MREYVNKFINYVLDKIIYPGERSLTSFVFYFCENEPKSQKSQR